MSAEEVVRVLKKIKIDCYKDREIPKYYTPFFKENTDVDIFAVSTLFEALALKKEDKSYNCFDERTLYVCLLKDKKKYGRHKFGIEYIHELQSIFD